MEPAETRLRTALREASLSILSIQGFTCARHHTTHEKTLSRAAYSDRVVNSEFTEELMSKLIYGKYDYTAKQINYYADKFSKLNEGALYFWMDLIRMISTEGVQNVESHDRS